MGETEMDLSNQEYDALVRGKAQPSPLWKDLAWAFCVGGGICAVGQGLLEWYQSLGLERTPPELVADISTNGIVMTGGGSLLWGFDKLIESHTGIETHVAEDAISCVAEGTGKSLDSLDQMQDGTMNLSRRKQMNY